MSHGFRVGRKKSQANLAKHGIDFHTASLAFDHPFALTMRDELHSDLESRFIMLAAIATGVILFVVFTVRARDVIRLISARAATRRERAIYEEAK